MFVCMRTRGVAMEISLQFPWNSTMLTRRWPQRWSMMIGSVTDIYASPSTYAALFSLMRSRLIDETMVMVDVGGGWGMGWMWNEKKSCKTLHRFLDSNVKIWIVNSNIAGRALIGSAQVAYSFGKFIGRWINLIRSRLTRHLSGSRKNLFFLVDWRGPTIYKTSAPLYLPVSFFLFFSLL